MFYKLTKLAPGSYDVWRDGQIIASLVRGGDYSRRWVVELLVEVPPHQLPTPFTALEHPFGSLEEACVWLDAEAGGSSLGAKAA